MGQASVFEQVIKLISRSSFESIVHRHQANLGTRTLDSWTWFGALLFGQLSGHDSIRAIERVFCHSNSRIKKLGFTPVARSTLSDANHARPVGFLEDLFTELVRKARTLAPGQKILNLEAKNILLMDSTTMRLALTLCPWARLDSQRASCKLHTAIDLAGEIPQFAVITPSRVQDITIAKKMTFQPGTTVVFDRGYFDQSFFNRLNEENVFFVSRAKSNNKFKIVECRPTNRTLGFKCDQIAYCKDRLTRRPKGKIRRIHYVEPDTGKDFVFITNHFDLPAETIAALYKARWKVELFFKSIKMNLKIRKFLGNSVHAVKAQILVALIAYTLVHMIRSLQKAKISMPSAMAVIGTLLLLKEPLSRLFGELPRVYRHPPGPQLYLPF